MSRLELKVPPDFVALAVAALMWLVSKVTPSLAVPAVYRVPVAIGAFAGGIALIVAARVAFARAATTFSPIAPDLACHLVTTGVYGRSRNPMYLGTLLVLVAFAVLLSNPVSAVVAMTYVAYIDRFQIRPEERVLRDSFGGAYEDYLHRVRRWV